MLADQAQFIRFNQQSHLGAQIEQIVRRHGINPPRRLEVDSSDTLTSMVAAGLGWALTTPICLLQALHQTAGVRIQYPPSIVGSRSLYLLARGEQHDKVVGKLADIINTILTNEILPRLESIQPQLVDAISFASLVLD